jgi:D-lactate dehydrogenase
VPLWSPDLPKGGPRRNPGGPATAQAVYFQACVGTMFGPAEGGEGVAAALVSLASKAGVELRQPDEIGGLCCGTPWKSKGMLDGYAAMVERTIGSLWRASDGGRLPIVSDNSSCSEGIVLALEKAIEHHPEYSSLRILDAVDFAASHLLPLLEVGEKLDSIVVHPTCSSTRAGSNAHLAQLAAAVATEVVIPDDWGCCAFAGDRGMLHPELTASATVREAREVDAREFDAYASCNRTCEIGMSRATGHPYQHVLEVLDRSARSRT